MTARDHEAGARPGAGNGGNGDGGSRPGAGGSASRPGAAVWVRTVVAVVAVAMAWSGVADRSGQEYNDGVFRQALVTFAAARTLDAAISLAQGTEIALQPAGMGVTLTAGEILDPINDLVEQFASVMLVATVSLGVQSVLLRIGAWWVLTGLLALAAAAHLAFQWGLVERLAGRSTEESPRLATARNVAAKLLAVVLVIRFVMPVVAIGSALVFEHFLGPAQEESVRVLEDTSTDIRQMEQLDESAEELRPGLLERMTSWFRDTVAELDVSERIGAFRERLADATEHIIHLIVVFSLQTILIPLGFLWLLPRIVGFAVDRLS